MDRSIRNLIQQKGSKVKVVASAPVPSEGKDGDIVLFGRGVRGVLYVKGFGKWWAFRSSDAKGDGWHGSHSKVKILPTQFMSGSVNYKVQMYVGGWSSPVWDVGAGSSSFEDAAMMVSVSIPKGYRATGCYIFDSTSDTGTTVNVVRTSIDAAAIDVIGTGTINELVSFSSHSFLENQFLTVSLSNVHSGAEIRGGYIAISPILTPELIEEGTTSEDGLFRGGE